MSDLQGKLRVLDPWFDPIEEIEQLYSTEATKQIAQRYVHLISEHVAPPYVFAVDGTWGGGKTTFLRFLCNELEAKTYETLWFNPWEYERQGDVVLALQKQMATKFQGVLGPKQASFPIVRDSVVAVFVGAQPSYSSRLAG